MVGRRGDHGQRGAGGGVLLVSSPGGVLLDALAVRAAWPGADPVSWVAVRAPDTEELLAGEEVRWTAEPSAGGVRSLASEVVAARRVLGRSRPDWVVSAGTAVAVPWFLAARSRRIPTLWIETLNLHGPQGRAAEVCSRLAERVLVQRADRLLDHRRAVLVGELY